MHDEVTEKDIERMKEEIEYRKLVVRKEALEAVKEARAHGDLSENFEYHAAKKDKNANESRIRYLERMIKTAVVVSDESKSDEDGINNKVTLYFEDDDEEDDETKQQTNNDDEENEQEKKRGLFTRVLAVLIAIVSVVFFLVTEDLSLPWTWTDQWTIWMVVIGLVQIVVFFVGRKWKNVDNYDEDEEAQQA